MKALEYTAEILNNGLLSVPPEILKQINIKKNSKVKVLILYEEDGEAKSLGKFCGKWKDERTADKIVEDIYFNRKNNTRSEDFEL